MTIISSPAVVYLMPVSDQQITVGTTFVNLLRPQAATHAIITVESQPVRWRMNRNPTATVGSRLAVGDALEWMEPLVIYSNLLDTLRFIRDTAATADATLDVQYFAAQWMVAPEQELH